MTSQRSVGDYADEYYFYNQAACTSSKHAVFMTRVDIRQSVTNIIDNSFELVQGYEYDEFGNQTVTGDTGFLNDVTFTGAIADSTGLYYMNARFYNPNTGRFLTQDSYMGNAYEPWSQHLYSYTGNNPVNFIDPTGHNAEKLNLFIKNEEDKEAGGDTYGIGGLPFTSGNAADYNPDYLNNAQTNYTNGLWASPELAAYAFGQMYNDDSIKEHSEYEAIIMGLEYNGEKVYTWEHVYIGDVDKGRVVKMWIGQQLSRALQYTFPVPGVEFIGTVHTHANYEWAGNQFFSSQDQNWLKGQTYMISPDGSLHYDGGFGSVFTDPEGKWTQQKIELYNNVYGTILGYNLPFDTKCGSYAP